MNMLRLLALCFASVALAAVGNVAADAPLILNVITASVVAIE